jgi:hypothetical protein
MPCLPIPNAREGNLSNQLCRSSRQQFCEMRHSTIRPSGVVPVRCIAFILTLLLAGGSSRAAVASDIAVVVRPDTPAGDLSLREVRDLLFGERQFWTSNLRVTLLIREPAARERDVMLRVVYHMTEAQFRQFWISKIFRAETSSGPKIVYSSQMASELISALPGSVSFLDVADVPKGLKVLKIDGKLPGDPGYPLR